MLGGIINNSIATGSTAKTARAQATAAAAGVAPVEFECVSDVLLLDVCEQQWQRKCCGNSVCLFGHSCTKHTVIHVITLPFSCEHRKRQEQYGLVNVCVMVFVRVIYDCDFVAEVVLLCFVLLLFVIVFAIAATTTTRAKGRARGVDGVWGSSS